MPELEMLGARRVQIEHVRASAVKKPTSTLLASLRERPQRWDAAERPGTSRGRTRTPSGGASPWLPKECWPVSCLQTL